MRSLPMALAVTISIACAAPAAATAAAGWKLPEIANEVSGLKVSSTAVHCGKSTFGTWKFRGRMSGEGKVAHLRWRTKITKDGTPHRLTRIRVSGTAPEDAKAGIMDSLGAQRMRYVPGPPPQLEVLTSTGERASTRGFQPKRTNRC